MMSSTSHTGDDLTGSFISQLCVKGSPSGPLQGHTFAVKDLFDVAGHPTGLGHPLWLTTHPIPESTAPPVQALLDAGACLIGKTHMDELAYTPRGENPHYGTPVNVAAPGRVPGGSSSGSAAAVAAGQADTALGSDTGGSVRAPASFCGLFGFRPTHGRISMAGSRALAPSGDTVGWFARDAGLLQQVGNVLFAHPSSSNAVPGRPPAAGTPHTSPPSTISSSCDLAQPTLLVARDAFALADPETSQAVHQALVGLINVSEAAGVLGPVKEVDVGSSSQLDAAGLTGVRDWMNVFWVVLSWEIWQQLGPWVTEHKPHFGPGIKEKLEAGASITEQQWKEQDELRTLISNHLEDLLGSNAVIALPTMPGPAVPLNTPDEQLGDYWARAFSLMCMTALAGLPEVTLPLAKVDGLPVGLSLIGPRNSDEQLLELVTKLMPAGKQ